ncbi:MULTISPECIES: DNA-directed RNA polymerase [unclassified Thioalkalivibrio]|uniref:DNA-directed RNA polymerase n=1 Tax=unclassified Thioalkalivibrio TaxID=2621013 RepID=UPI0003612961|nr:MULTISPECIES: DNA-directed RNA polymerase [unclassified Thioalkalivibrio]
MFINNHAPSITDQIIEEIDSNPEWNEKMPRQAELEEKMRCMGVDRFWSQTSRSIERGQETQIAPVRRLMNHAVAQMVEAIDAFIAEASSGKAGRKHGAVKFIQQIESEAAALITVRSVLDGVIRGERLVPLARTVAGMIEDELAFRHFMAEDPQAFNWLVRREKRVNGASYRRQRKSLYANAKGRDIHWEEWNHRDQVIVGTKLIEIMAVATGLVEKVVRAPEVNKKETYIVATKEAMDWLNEEMHRSEAMSPSYLPTIIPPRPWTSPTDGGYWTPRVRRLSLVKTHSKEYLTELAEHHMPGVYDAINVMQHTAWAINLEVLDVVRTLWNSQSVLGGIPSGEDYPLPVKPQFLIDELPKEEWNDDQLSAFRTWKRQTTDTHTANAKLKSLRLQFAKTLMVAEMLEEEEEIYFPHQFDFRGRAYPVPMFLTPQGSDVAKGLLTFANGVTIDDQEGADWLAIHGANVYGYDKDSLEGRVAWVMQHEREILASAEDPYDNRFWVDADKPFQFLAFCFEWAGFKREGFGYLSTLPVQMDGSCNGLQNFSAMLRDETGGRAVNLTPTDMPQDIYQQVADVVLQRVQEDAEKGDPEVSPLARGWLKHGITRKVCKRPVMTLTYGAKLFGFRQQVLEDTVQPYKFHCSTTGEEFPWSSAWDAASYMGGLIWESVGQVVVAARSAMDWLQEIARTASKEGLPVRWETSDGMVVLQAYPKMNSKQIQLTFGSSRITLSVATTPTKKLDKQRQANGIAPNWVHSMDAAHMRATVRRCWSEGVRSFGLVHDSYGTHAGNAWALAKYLREEFVGLYSEDVLEEFRRQMALQLGDVEAIPDVPPKGTLDLSLVLDSAFFFA